MSFEKCSDANLIPYFSWPKLTRKLKLIHRAMTHLARLRSFISSVILPSSLVSGQLGPKPTRPNTNLAQN